MGDTADSVLAELGKAGAKKVLKVKNEKLVNYDSQLMTSALEQIAAAEGADVIIFSHDFTSKAIAPRLAARLKAGFVPAAVDYPIIEGANFSVKKASNSGRGMAPINRFSPRR